MKLLAIALAMFLLVPLGCGNARPDELVLVSIGQPERVAVPIVSPGGRVLSGRFGGSEAEIVEVLGGKAVSRARVSADGLVTGLQLGRGPANVPVLAVVVSCPGGFGDQPESEEFRTCVTPPAMTSVELEDDGGERGKRTSLPPGIGEGTLFGSGEVFVWAGWDAAARALYADGVWQRIVTSEPGSRPVAGRCVSATDLWVLRGDAAAGSPGYALFRYRLDGSVANPWEQVSIPGLEEAEAAQLACGDEEAFVRAGDSLYSTAEPRSPLPGTEAGIDELRSNVARRPVIFLEDRTCSIVTAGGRLLRGREVQGSATSPKASSCDTVPWPKGAGFIGLAHDLLGNIRLGTW